MNHHSPVKKSHAFIKEMSVLSLFHCRLFYPVFLVWNFTLI